MKNQFRLRTSDTDTELILSIGKDKGFSSRLVEDKHNNRIDGDAVHRARHAAR